MELTSFLKERIRKTKEEIMKTNWVIEFGEIEDVNTVGEKSWNLSQMVNQGHPIPHGFAITKQAFENFLSYNDIENKVAPILKSIDYSDPVDLKRGSEKIRDIVISSKVPRPVVDDIIKLKTELSDGAMMVRSSALGEDSEDSSFAGQLDSFITEGTDDEIIESLLLCWASYWSERALFYQNYKKVSLQGMGVVVQEMVQPVVAGVLFTRNPNHSSKPEMLLEYCFGHAEILVSGQITPGAITINRDNKAVEILSSPDQIDYKSEEHIVTGKEKWITDLFNVALKLEKELGRPADIEWAVNENGEVKIVQSRPITQLHDLKEKSSEKLVHWSNVNVNENYPTPISPLLYSVALQSFYHYFRDLGKSFGIREKRLIENDYYLKNIIGSHGGKMYYNMTSIHSCIQILPFGKKLSGYFNNFVGDPRSKTEGLEDKTSENILELLTQTAEVFLILFTTLRTFLFIPFKIKSLEDEVDTHLKKCQTGPGKNDVDNHLKECFNGFLKIRFLSWKKASLADSLAMFAYGALGSFLSRYIEKADATKNTLLQGIPNLVSSVPPEKIWELSTEIKSSPELMELFKKDSKEIYSELQSNKQYIKFKDSLDDFLLHWGHRCSGELMLTEPNFQEDPASFLDTLKGYIKADVESPKKVIARKTIERAKIIKDTQFKLFKTPLDFILWPFKALFFRVTLAATAQGIRYRERVRLKQAMIYGAFRQTLLTLSHRMINKGILKNEDDIFFLTYEEISHFVAGAEMLPNALSDIANERREEHQRVTKLSPPDHFYLPEGEYFESMESVILEKRENIQHDEFTLVGLAACGGTKKGRAKILESALDAKDLTPGDILVTKQTDPGWATVFPLISALVIERGGMLSHGAIVAREFGIPAVVGADNATSSIKDETEIFVDGDNGIVKLQ